MPPLSKKQYEALEKSIIEDGVILPVLVDERGDVIDGHHRQEIAERHKIPYQKQVVKGITDKQAGVMAIKLNLLRRNMADHVWGQIFEELMQAGKNAVLPETSVENEQESASDPQCAKVAQKESVAESCGSVRSAARMTGVPEATARRRVKVARDYKLLPPQAKKKVDAGKTTVARAVLTEKNKAEEFMEEEKGLLEQAKDMNTVLTDVMSLIQKTRALVKGHTTNPHLRHNPFDRAMKDAWEIAKFAVPHSLCPYCSGEQCKRCEMLGWMPKDIFDRVPAKDKK